MQIQMDMTERDKKLLYRLGIVVILAIFILLAIRPLYISMKEKDEDIAAAEETKQILDEKCAMLPGLQEIDANLQTEIQELQSDYYEPMYSAQIDELLTNYMLGKGLMAKDMVISMPTDTVVMEPYVNSEAGKKAAGIVTEEAETEQETEITTELESEETEETAETESSENSGTESIASITNTEVTDTTASGIYAVTVSMKVQGTDENITKMLDDIDGLRPSTRVVSCKWEAVGKEAVQNEDGEIELQESENQQLQLTLQLFMTGLK
ncbi:MAG: hypothetical protein K6B41_06235 [Butyrivibrio sp.]|nr:hypothetical protein [Butyrivibrio sp.]